MARAAQAAAQVGVLPVQEVAFVEAAHGAQRVGARQHARARQPVDGQAAAVTERATTERRCARTRPDSETAGAARRCGRTRPVNMSGSPRALPCSAPSGSRMRGPTMAQSGCRVQLARQRLNGARLEPAVRIHDQHERRARHGQRLVDGAAEPDVLRCCESASPGPETRARCRRCRPTTRCPRSRRPIPRVRMSSAIDCSAWRSSAPAL